MVQVGVAGLRRNLVEIDSEGHRSLKGTEVLKEAVTEIVEVGTKVVKVAGDRPAPATQDTKKETEPKTETSVASVQVSQAVKQEPAKAEAQAKAEKTEGKQLPNTSAEVDANLLALGLVGVLSGFGLLAQKRKED